MVYASAGHCPGYIVDRAGQTTRILDVGGIPLGIDSTSDFPVSPAIALEPGDVLFLHTDGIVEAGSSSEYDLFGIERALSIVREHRVETPAEILDALFHAPSDFSQPREPVDDVTAVIIKVQDHADELEK